MVIEKEELELKRCEELWFDDGTLVIRAESSLFRVYKGILSSRSSVFRDMVSFPLSKDQEFIEGCPMLHLHDSAADTKYFLLALHHSGFFENAEKTEFEIVAGVLRLSTKYDVKYLRRRAIRHLSLSYPTSLEAWDRRHETRTIPPIPFTPFAVLNLARETDILGILPGVMYCCNTRSAELIFDGVTFKDSHVELDLVDKRTCLFASAKLLDRKQRDIYGFLRLDCVDGCRDHSTCDLQKLQWLSTGTCFNRSALSDDFNWPEFKNDVCSRCFSVSQNSFRKARRDLWADLPNLFNLPSWSELEASLVA